MLPEMDCYIFVSLLCETFVEEYELAANYIDMDAFPCYIRWFLVIWGEGFAVNNTLIAVIAGMNSRVRPQSWRDVH